MKGPSPATASGYYPHGTQLTVLHLAATSSTMAAECSRLFLAGLRAMHKVDLRKPWLLPHLLFQIFKEQMEQLPGLSKVNRAQPPGPLMSCMFQCLVKGEVVAFLSTNAYSIRARRNCARHRPEPQALSLRTGFFCCVGSHSCGTSTSAGHN